REIISRWSNRDPAFRHVVYEPASCAAIRRAHHMCFERAVLPHYRFDNARLIVGLEADFLGTWVSPVEFTAQYARGRRPGPGMSRHVQFDSGASLTGAKADVRYGVAPSEIGLVALALLERVEPSEHNRAVSDAQLPVSGAALDALAGQLRERQGESLVVCGS